MIAFEWLKSMQTPGIAGILPPLLRARRPQACRRDGGVTTQRPVQFSPSWAGLSGVRRQGLWMEAGFLEGLARRRKQHHGPHIARGTRPMSRKKTPQARRYVFFMANSWS